MSVSESSGGPLEARTLREDMWWLESALTVAGLGAFIVYSTWAAFQNANYYVAPYLSPFYSPQMTYGLDPEHVTFPLFGSWYGFSPAFLILWAPGGFRMTCYYYRKAYYRAFFWSPPACAVDDFRKKYKGETKFPYILQNLHRYFYYVAVLFIFLLAYDAIMAFRFPAPGGGHQFGVGIGTFVMILNVTFLGLFTFSCNSCRHLCGGGLNKFSEAPGRYKIWRAVSAINTHHGKFAWISLFWVGFTDIYIRLLATGVISETFDRLL